MDFERHATLLFCAKSATVQGNGAEKECVMKEERDLDGEIQSGESNVQTIRERFVEAEDFESAVGVVWGESFKPHNYYQHYTTLSKVVTKLSEKRWWFANSYNGDFNDRQESLKFGDSKISKRTYQASFVHGTAENVALWSMYAPSDPFAIRITMPGEKLGEWVDSLRGKYLYSESDKKTCKIEKSELKDIIYAAVDFRDRKRTSRDIGRCNSLYWSEVSCDVKMPSLEEQIKKAYCTGWMKDYEWRHERESRICLRVKKAGGPKGLWCEVTPELIESMKFTFSPWLPKEYEDEVKEVIVNALKITEEKRGSRAKQYSDRFRRSVLQGAINLRKSTLKCVFNNNEDMKQSCPLFKL